MEMINENVCMQRRAQYPRVTGAAVDISSLLSSESHVWGCGCSNCYQGGNFTSGGIMGWWWKNSLGWGQWDGRRLKLFFFFLSGDEIKAAASRARGSNWNMATKKKKKRYITAWSLLADRIITLQSGDNHCWGHGHLSGKPLLLQPGDSNRSPNQATGGMDCGTVCLGFDPEAEGKMKAGGEIMFWVSTLIVYLRDILLWHEFKALVVCSFPARSTVHLLPVSPGQSCLEKKGDYE